MLTKPILNLDLKNMTMRQVYDANRAFFVSTEKQMLANGEINVTGETGEQTKKLLLNVFTAIHDLISYRLSIVEPHRNEEIPIRISDRQWAVAKETIRTWYNGYYMNAWREFQEIFYNDYGYNERPASIDELSLANLVLESLGLGR